MTKIAEDKNLNAQIGKELVQSALGGLGVGTGAASLYYLLNGLRTAESPLSRQPAGFAPGAKTKKTKKPSRDPNSPINSYKTAEETGFVRGVYDTIGRSLPKEYPLWLSKLVGGPTKGSIDMWRLAGNLGLAGLGGYAGMSAVNHIADKQRAADSKDDVEQARQEYFAALTGKTAAALDAAFDAFQEAGHKEASFLGNVGGAIDQAFGRYVATPALLTALAGSLVGGTYMYNQVKDRTRAENLRRAAAARARLAGLQKTPYVDPVELAALTKK